MNTSKKSGIVPIDSPHLIDVSRRGVRRGVAPKTVRRRAEKILQELSCERCELSVVLCNDLFIHELNKEYRGKDRPTDVLSFPMSDVCDAPAKDTHLGDIVISVETAERQAAARSQSLLSEVTFLLCHGILHLVGFTHENDEDEAEMNQRTKELVALFS